MRLAGLKSVFAFFRIALLFILAVASSSIAQAERLPIKSYTTADGLPHEGITRLVRDSRGFLWFCTVDGLSRFDGKNFVNYGVEQGLPNSIIGDLVEARNGSYWIATFAGVCRFNPSFVSGAAAREAISRFTIYRLGDEARANRIYRLYEDRAGRIWAGSQDGAFVLDEPNGERSFHHVELGLSRQPDGLLYVWGFVEDDEGSLWIGTSLGLVRHLPDGQMIHYGNNVSSMIMDGEGRLWIGCNAGLVIFKPEPLAAIPSGHCAHWSEENLHKNASLQNARLPMAAGEAVLFAIVDRTGRDVGRVLILHKSYDGRICIGTDGGMTEFADGRIRHHTISQGLPDNRIRALADDSAGNLWVGTETAGAVKIARNGLITFTTDDGLGRVFIRSIFEAQTGEFCVVNRTPIINRFDGKQFMPVKFNLPKDSGSLSWNRFEVPFQDHTGEWWIPTGKALYRFSKVARLEHLSRARPKAVYTMSDGLPSLDMSCVFEDSRGDIWIGSVGKVPLTRWERATETFRQYSEADGLQPFNLPLAMREDRSGGIWMGFEKGGLARYVQGRFTLMTASDGLPPGEVPSLFLDSAGRLWVAINGGGVVRIDDPSAERPRLQTYSMAQGLSSITVTCVAEDLRGRIYVGTKHGIDQLNIATGQVKHYTTADGLSHSEMWRAFRDRAGALWFGTYRGLSKLVPVPEQPEPPPPVFVISLLIAGISQSLSELGEKSVATGELGPGQNQIQIGFFGLGFGIGETLRYQYKLEDADRDWSAPTDQRTVNYANLAPGNYNFLVRAVSPDGTLSESPAAVTFKILPPIWRRWWFVTIATLIIASAVSGFARYRYHRLKAVREAEEALRRSREERLVELERVRARIATDLHDDIGSSLTQIAILSEVAHQQANTGDNRQGAERLARIISVSNELVDTMSDIVWAINPKKDHLSDLLQRMRRFASDIFTARGIAFRFSAPDSGQDIEIGANVRREVFLIFKESINNIIKHSGCTRAEIEFHIGGDWLTLKVADDGKGFDTTLAGDPSAAIISSVRGGNGILSMRKRAEEMGGQFEISSGKGCGTTATLRVLVSQKPAETK